MPLASPDAALISAHASASPGRHACKLPSSNPTTTQPGCGFAPTNVARCPVSDRASRPAPTWTLHTLPPASHA